VITSHTGSIRSPFQPGNGPARVLTTAAAFSYIRVGVIYLLRHPVVVDVEMLQAALSLRTPIPVSRHLHRAQAVELLPHPSSAKADRHIEDLRRLLIRTRHDIRPPTQTLTRAPVSGPCPAAATPNNIIVESSPPA